MRQSLLARYRTKVWELAQLRRGGQLDIAQARALRGLIQHRPVSTVLDVGANRGQYGRQLRRAGFAGHIVSVEPLPAALAALEPLAAADGDWTVRRGAVVAAPVDGTVRLHVTAAEVLSSVLPPRAGATEWTEGLEVVDELDVAAWTLDEVLADTPGDRVGLKLDVQGHDLALLRSGALRDPRIAWVQTEVPLGALYEGVEGLDAHVAACAEHGFVLASVLSVSLVPYGRPPDADAIFVRSA